MTSKNYAQQLTAELKDNRNNNQEIVDGLVAVPVGEFIGDATDDFSSIQPGVIETAVEYRGVPPVDTTDCEVIAYGAIKGSAGKKTLML